MFYSVHTTRFFCLIFAALAGGWIQMLQAQAKTKAGEVYIEQFKSIAVREMERGGVPASIILAQGLHESGCGQSELAKSANNHFGIKCGTGWNGKSYQKVGAGETVVSCFRAYANPEQGYIDHTDFLTKRRHYRFLFEYPTTDYKSWAEGLQKAGYAADPKYPVKLVAIIELYKLNQYDKKISRPDTAIKPNVSPIIEKADPLFLELITNDHDTAVLNAKIPSDRPFYTKKQSVLFSAYQKGIFKQNGASYMVAQQNESALEAANRFGIPYHKFLKFNDLRDGDVLIDFQYVYLQPKKASFNSKTPLFHKIAQNETIYEIGQFYGIREAALRARNKLATNEEVEQGELILLKEKAITRPKLRTSNTPTIVRTPSTPIGKNTSVSEPAKVVERPAPQKIELNQPTYPAQVYTAPQNTVQTPQSPTTSPKLPQSPTTSPKLPQSPTTSPKLPQSPTTSPKLPQSPTTSPKLPQSPTTSPKSSIPNPQPAKNLLHTVKAGETLSKIARQYGLSPLQIQQYNRLSNDNIKIGQSLKIPR